MQVIEVCFIKQFYVNNPPPPSGKFQICYKGSYWNVEASKVDNNFVFASGWPEMCNDVGILEDDLLVFSRIDDVVFEVVVYRDETKIYFLKKPESDDDSVLEISKADYVENAFKDIYEDEEVVSVGEGTTVTQNLPTNAECTSKRHMSSRLNKTQDVKKKGKVTSERKEMVKNRTKGNAALPVDTSDHIGCSSSVHKVKGKRAANVQKKLNRRNKIAKTAKKNILDIFSTLSSFILIAKETIGCVFLLKLPDEQVFLLIFIL
ncbi:putative transcription factor B3-Domain family [Helianthus annuus]|nr:putative transcription factor B3-Domain family [Helianthus annuus]